MKNLHMIILLSCISVLTKAQLTTKIINYKNIEYEVITGENIIFYEKLTSKKLKSASIFIDQENSIINISNFKIKELKTVNLEIQQLIDSYLKQNKITKTGQNLFMNLYLNKKGKIVFSQLITPANSIIQLKHITEIEKELEKLIIKNEYIEWREKTKYASATIKIRI